MDQSLFDLLTVHLHGDARQRWMIAVAQHALERLPVGERRTLLQQSLHACFPPDAPPMALAWRAYTYRLLVGPAPDGWSLPELYATMTVACCVDPTPAGDLLGALMVADYAEETARAVGGPAEREQEQAWQMQRAREYAPAHRPGAAPPGAPEGGWP